MNSLFVCLFHTRYNSDVVRVFYTQCIIRTIALSVNIKTIMGLLYTKKPNQQESYTTEIYTQPTKNAKVPHLGFLAQRLMARSEPIIKEAVPPTQSWTV